MGAGSGFFLGMVGFGGFGVVGCGSGLAGVGGIDPAVVGHIAPQIGCHGFRHDQHRHPIISTFRPPPCARWTTNADRACRFQSPTNAAAELGATGPPWQTTSPASDDVGCAGGAGRRESNCPRVKRSAATGQSLIRSCEFVRGCDLFWHAFSPAGWSDAFTRFGRGEGKDELRRAGTTVAG